MKAASLRTLRIVVSLAFFLGLLAVFLDPIQILPPAIADALTWPQFIPALLRISGAGLFAASAFLFVVLLTILFGRVYCSGICPLGTYQDIVARLARRGRRARYKEHPGFPRTHFIITGLIFLSATALGTTALGWFDPYSIFGRFTAFAIKPITTVLHNAAVFLLNASGTHFATAPMPPWAVPSFLFMAATLAVVTAMAATRGRLFCNTVCPVGGALRILARFSVFRIHLDPAACTACTRCHRSCKAQCIDARNHKIDTTRCVACFNCLDSCPRNGIAFLPFWKIPSSTPSPARPATPHSATPTPSLKAEPQQGKQLETGLRSRRSFFATGAAMLTASLPAVAQQQGRGRGRGLGKGRGQGWGQPPENYPASRPPLAPPGAGSTRRFHDLCTACGLCLSQCPTGVLQPAFLQYGLSGLFQPRMDFHAASCTYECHRCMEVCPTSALQPLPLAQKKLVQLGIAEFYKHLCIVHEEHTACGACAEHCPTAAVKMIPWRNGLTMPVVEPDLCIGCGACEHACPTAPRAIIVRPHQMHQTAIDPASEPPVQAPRSDEPFPF